MGTLNKVIDEGMLKFSFDESTKAIKFDESVFYRKRFNSFPGSKGIDILAESEEMIQFIEIKDCRGHESENVWRTSVNNSKIESAPRELDVENRNSLDIEVVKKVTTSIACLYGAWTESQHTESSIELAGFWGNLNSPKIPKDKKKLWVILFLEGNFGVNCPASRTKPMIMKRLRESIEKKLKWLNCQVLVVDSDTYKGKFFKVEGI